MPISKFQSDNLFFRCRSQKSILQSAAFTFRKLLESEKVKKEIKLGFTKIKKRDLNIFAGKKATLRVFDTPTSGGTVRLLALNYLIRDKRSYKSVSFKHSNQYYYLNLCVTNCLYRAGCKTKCPQIPIADKYLFFVEP